MSIFTSHIISITFSNKGVRRPNQNRITSQRRYIRSHPAKMKTLTSYLVTISAAFAVALPLTASALTLTSTVTQSGAFDSGIGGPGTNGSSGMADSVPITGTTLNGITNP